jgi:hypothetical protein
MENVPDNSGGATSTGMGVTILNNNDGNTSDGAAPTSGTVSAPVAAGGGNLPSVGPANNGPLPSVEKPAEAEMQHNDVQAGPAPPQSTVKTKKNAKVKVNKKQESSTKDPNKKKGLDKLNPF